MIYIARLSLKLRKLRTYIYLCLIMITEDRTEKDKRKTL